MDDSCPGSAGQPMLAHSNTLKERAGRKLKGFMHYLVLFLKLLLLLKKGQAPPELAFLSANAVLQRPRLLI